MGRITPRPGSFRSLILFVVIEMIAAIVSLHQRFGAAEADLWIESGDDVFICAAVQAEHPIGDVHFVRPVRHWTARAAHLHAVGTLFLRVFEALRAQRFPQQTDQVSNGIAAVLRSEACPLGADSSTHRVIDRGDYRITQPLLQSTQQKNKSPRESALKLVPLFLKLLLNR
jgi:hypothetical protein